jgi:glycosyltransferase involved in cell wall biosynthesis
MTDPKRDRQLCIVDPSFTLESPSMKHLVYAVPALIREGWKIAVIAERIEAHLPVEFLPLKPRKRNPLFRTFELFALMQKNVREFRIRHPEAIMFGTPGLPYDADVSAVHFLNHVWLRQAKKIPTMSLRERTKLIFSRLYDWRTAKDFRSSITALWLPVSESIANELQKVVAHPERIRLLANSYDETRFNSGARDRFRRVRRAALGFDTKDFVFVFLSQGHHRRKGFWLAIQALAQLRRSIHSLPFRPALLVIGGSPETLGRLTRELSRMTPDWSDWIFFTGMVERPEENLAAADAFLFPSFFEAFCLAEIEAAAMQLPLLLTAHYGSEMILEHGRNGLEISFNVSVMAQQLFDFLSGSSRLGPIDSGNLRPRNFRPSVGRALTRQQYGARLINLLDAVSQTKAKTAVPVR